MFTEENTNVILSSRQIQFFLKCVALQQSVELVLRDVRLVSTGELERLIDEKKAQSTSSRSESPKQCQNGKKRDELVHFWNQSVTAPRLKEVQ